MACTTVSVGGEPNLWHTNKLTDILFRILQTGSTYLLIYLTSTDLVSYILTYNSPFMSIIFMDNYICLLINM